MMDEVLISDVENNIERLGELEDFVYDLQSVTGTETDLIIDHGEWKIKDTFDDDVGEPFGEFICFNPDAKDGDEIEV